LGDLSTNEGADGDGELRLGLCVGGGEVHGLGWDILFLNQEDFVLALFLSGLAFTVVAVKTA